LSHLAREETSKCIILLSTGIDIIREKEVDWKSVLRKLVDHKEKLAQEISLLSIFASAAGDEEKSKEMINYARAFAKVRNNKKNSSLYVGFSEGKISIPSEEISKEQAHRTIQLSKLTLEQQKAFREIYGSFNGMCTRLLNIIRDPNFKMPNLGNESWSDFSAGYKNFLEGYVFKRKI
jgi:AbiV family abortive infection protein